MKKRNSDFCNLSGIREEGLETGAEARLSG
jgi:hypothetical protein